MGTNRCRRVNVQQLCLALDFLIVGVAARRLTLLAWQAEDYTTIRVRCRCPPLPQLFAAPGPSAYLAALPCDSRPSLCPTVLASDVLFVCLAMTTGCATGCVCPLLAGATLRKWLPPPTARCLAATRTAAMARLPRASTATSTSRRASWRGAANLTSGILFCTGEYCLARGLEDARD